MLSQLIAQLNWSKIIIIVIVKSNSSSNSNSNSINNWINNNKQPNVVEMRGENQTLYAEKCSFHLQQSEVLLLESFCNVSLTSRAPVRTGAKQEKREGRAGADVTAKTELILICPDSPDIPACPKDAVANGMGGRS